MDMTEKTRASHLLSGLLGGLVAVVVGAILLATGVIQTGTTTREVVQAPLARPAEQSGGTKGLTVSQIYDRVGPGVAFIQAEVTDRSTSPFGLPQERQGEATGWGFLIDKQGRILTNAHVVDNATQVGVRFGEGELIRAKVLGKDLSTDVALLKIPAAAAKAQPLELADSKQAHVGDPVIAIGNPFGLDRT